MMNPLDTLGLISPPWIFGEIADPPTYQHDDTWNPPSLFGSFLLFGDVRNDLLVEFTTWKFYSRCGSWISINLGAPKTQQLNGCLFLKGVTWNLWCSRGFNMKKTLKFQPPQGGGELFLALSIRSFPPFRWNRLRGWKSCFSGESPGWNLKWSKHPPSQPTAL